MGRFVLRGIPNAKATEMLGMVQRGTLVVTLRDSSYASQGTVPTLKGRLFLYY